MSLISTPKPEEDQVHLCSRRAQYFFSAFRRPSFQATIEISHPRGCASAMVWMILLRAYGEELEGIVPKQQSKVDTLQRWFWKEDAVNWGCLVVRFGRVLKSWIFFAIGLGCFLLKCTHSWSLNRSWSTLKCFTVNVNHSNCSEKSTAFRSPTLGKTHE